MAVAGEEPHTCNLWSLLPGYHPHGMHDTWDVAENSQNDIDPEVLTDPYLQEYSKRRQEDRDDYS